MTCQSHHLCGQGRLAISTVTLLSLTGVLGFRFKPNCAELAF